MRGKSINYTAGELAWIEKHRTLTRRDLTAAFCKAFNRPDVTPDNLKALCTRKGWKTGRDGRLQPGSVSWNAGKKMPYNANSAKTQFKKGGRTGRANVVYKQIGTERVTVDGYVERKIHDGLPMQSRWRLVHLLNWEKENGPLPKGMCLKCLDGNRQNTDLNNWEAIPRGALPFMNGHRGPNYEAAAAEVRPVILTLAKVKHARFAKAPSAIRKDAST